MPCTLLFKMHHKRQFRREINHNYWRQLNNANKLMWRVYYDTKSICLAYTYAVKAENIQRNSHIFLRISWKECTTRHFIYLYDTYVVEHNGVAFDNLTNEETPFFFIGQIINGHDLSSVHVDYYCTKRRAFIRVAFIRVAVNMARALWYFIVNNLIERTGIPWNKDNLRPDGKTIRRSVPWHNCIEFYKACAAVNDIEHLRPDTPQAKLRRN